MSDHMIQKADDQISAGISERDRMIEQIKLLREALEFYANKENWGGYGDYPNSSDQHLIETSDIDTPKGIAICPVEVFFAGKRAREALKKLGEMK